MQSARPQRPSDIIAPTSDLDETSGSYGSGADRRNERNLDADPRYLIIDRPRGIAARAAVTRPAARAAGRARAPTHGAPTDQAALETRAPDARTWPAGRIVVEISNEPAAIRLDGRKIGDVILTSIRLHSRSRDPDEALGATTWRGERLLRISVSNWSTSEADIDVCVAAIDNARAALLAVAPRPVAR